MEMYDDLQKYLDYLCDALGHQDRNTGLKDYCQGLMLPIERKSVEPLAAHTDPLHVQAKHQSLHHFVAKSEWSDAAVLDRVRSWVEPALKLEDGCYWIVDDTGHPKQGKHSVGVTHQYCGQLGKTANCQVAVSLTLASERGSLPIAYRLYLPKDWADDAARRKSAGISEDMTFATKPQIALEQMRTARAAGIIPGIVLADAAYGDETAFRDGITDLGLLYAVGIRPMTNVWAPGVEPLPPKAWSGHGRPPERLRGAPGHAPASVKALAMDRSAMHYRTVSWREGTNTKLSSRFACLRIRPAHRAHVAKALRSEEWLLVEWPTGDKEPARYWFSTAPAEATLEQMVFVTKMRWRIERDYRELKQEFGLSHYEGRGWRGFHHHATLCVAAYGFLMQHRLAHSDSKKNRAVPKTFALSEDYVPRGRPACPTPRSRFDSKPSRSYRRSYRAKTLAVSVLREREAT